MFQAIRGKSIDVKDGDDEINIGDKTSLDKHALQKTKKVSKPTIKCNNNYAPQT